jgi:glyceraldehyde-3-phosphate dehydrogenase (NADP+)
MSTSPPIKQLWINGQRVAGAHTSDVVDPFSRRVVARVPLADERMIDQAISAAHAAFESMRRMPPFRRADTLAAAAHGIQSRKQEFAQTILAEAGKPISLAEAEVTRAVTTFTAAAEEARRLGSEVLQMDAFAAGAAHVGIARRFPIGVIYGITPFNFPLNLVAHKVAPALASGNTIVVKPSPRTPLSALLLAEVLHEANAPAGAVNVVVVPNDMASRPIDDPRIRHVSFTGSVAVGWDIKDRASRKRVTLELGGNAGLIIHEDADLAAAIPAAAIGAFAYAGQSCISVQRIFIHEPVYERFRDGLVGHTQQQVRAGDPRDPATLVGPLIDDAAVRRVQAMLDAATAADARVLCGGEFDGRCLQPTILESADPRLDVCAAEVFAPIAVLQPYQTFEQALSLVNDSTYGLQAGVFTRDIARAHQAFEQLDVGAVMINQVPTFRVENMPYGGIKASGFGREGVRYAMEEMTEIKVLAVRL